MCGIAGFIDRTAGESSGGAMLDAMLDSIFHRGPDGVGTYVHAPTGLHVGMRRLSIIDLSGGGQPIWNEDHSIGVVFNGEIYNYIELRRELVSRGHQFRTQSDTEVLVHGYEEFGTDMLPRLRGMFGFALFDLRKQELLLARDHFGQKPLYYCSQGDRLAFASEIKSLLALPWVPRELDRDAFLDHVSWLSIPAPRTHFSQIAKLLPGSYLKISLGKPGTARNERFWRYEVASQPDLVDMEDAARQLDDTLRDSIDVHLRADVPVGVLLSSGLDSRCIAAYAQEFLQGRLHTFSVGFTAEHSELAGALETSKELGTTHHWVELSAADLAADIESVAWHLDEPIGDPASFAVYRVCKLAREHVKVVLGGEGADELFAGYAARYQGNLETLERSDRLRRWRNWLPAVGVGGNSSRWGRLCRRAKMSHGAELLALRMEGFPGDVRHPRGLNHEQLQRLDAQQERLAVQMCRSQNELLAESTSLDIDWQLAESLLLKADKMSMAASIEMRSPFLDLEVARLASRMHPYLKTRRDGGPGKLVLRHCLARKMNESLTRPKRGFPVPLTTWLCGPLREQVEHHVLGSNSSLNSLLDRELVREAWQDVCRGHDGLGPLFYSLWLYDVWRERMSEGSATGDPQPLVISGSQPTANLLQTESMVAAEALTSE